jgi:hypothetical protein
VTVQQNTGYFTIQNQLPFPYLPMASDFSKTSPVVKDLNSIVFYFVSSVDTSPGRDLGLTEEVLVRSSARSGRQENVFMVNPQQKWTQEMFKESGIPLAITVEGSFQSAFRGKPVEVDSTVKSAIDTSSRLQSSIRTKIAVVGDGDFLQDQLSGGNRDNINFAGNLTDWLADDIGLAAIRSRDTGAKPLDEVSEGTKSLVKTINLAIPPFIVILVGVMRWRWRITMRKRLEGK